MPFTSETAKLHRGPGHRRKRAVVEAEKAAAAVVREIVEANAARLANRYVVRALGKNGDKVLVHAVDKLLPDEQTQFARPVQFNFVTFTGNGARAGGHTVQLQAEDVSSAVLAGNGNGHEKSREGMAQAERQGQNGFKFHDFKDVPGE